MNKKNKNDIMTKRKKGEKQLELKGEVREFIYQNEINAYSIALFETPEEEITIVGYLPFVEQGDSLKITGDYVEHKEYGLQFKVITFEKLIPETLSALQKFLANGKIKGVGPSIAKRIVDEFEENTINVIRYDPYKLAEIRGITKQKAKDIAESFMQNHDMWQIVSFLSKFNIGVEYAKRVYEKLGVDSIQKIEQNPYILIEITKGIDFKQIDLMAMKVGINPESSERIESAIKYALIKTSYNGNSCVIKNNLIEFVRNLLGVNEEIIEDNIINLKVKEEIIIEKREGMEWIYLSSFYKIEEEIAYRINKIQTSKNSKKIKNIDTQLKKIEKDSNIELSEKQIEAIKEINENNVLIITGGPGTGKTTIIKTIIDLYEQKGKKVVLAAPTGRAAKKMTEATGKEASTLHRLLCIGKLDDEGIYNKENTYQGEPIDADVVVIDELSMVDMFLMNYLLNSIYQGTKLILVGDVDQLPSVGPGAVLKNCIDSGTIKTVYLDKIFRQAAKSKIILNAHRVNKGEPFLDKNDIANETNQDFFYIKYKTQEEVLQEVISLCTGRLQNFGDFDFFQNIQILTPTKKGMLGTKRLNKELQAYLNPNTGKLPEKSNLGVIYRVGDRIMQIKNNYDMTWEKPKKYSEKEYGSGVFNGEFGTITKIDNKEKTLEIKFDDDKEATYEFSELDQIEHSYAITIHKAQRK